MFEANAQWNGQGSARTAATLAFPCVAVALGRKRRLKMERDCWGVQSVREFFSGTDRCIPIGTIRARRDANHFREHLRLAVAHRRIIWEGHPEWHTGTVRLAAGDQQTASGNVQGLAKLRFLSEGSIPAKPYRETKLRAVVLASVHKSSAKAHLGGALPVYADIRKLLTLVLGQ